MAPIRSKPIPMEPQMLDRREILRTAWKNYRLARPALYLPSDANGSRCFYRPLFADQLRRAWTDAVRQASAERFIAERLAAEAASKAAHEQAMHDWAARLTSDQRTGRIAAIRSEIELLPFTPLSMSIRGREAKLRDELAALEAVEAHSLQQKAA